MNVDELKKCLIGSKILNVDFFEDILNGNDSIVLRLDSGEQITINNGCRGMFWNTEETK